MQIEQLCVKRIDDLKIPDQFKTIIHITTCLATNNTLNDSLIDEILKHFAENTQNLGLFGYILNHLSNVFPKNVSFFTKIYQAIKSQFENSPFMFEFRGNQNNTEIFKEGSVFHSVLWDNLDDLENKMKSEDFDIDEMKKGLSLIDVACKYGSEKCFTYLKLKGSKISDKTFSCAIKGANKHIIITLYNEHHFDITKKHLKKALKYHQNDIFDWLLETKGSLESLKTAECISYGNLAGLLFFIENGFDINQEYLISHYYMQKTLLYLLLKWNLLNLLSSLSSMMQTST